MDYKTIKVTLDERGVAELVLNRPERKNALSADMMSELTHFAGAAAKCPNTRVVLLRGSEGTFCAGGDLGWMMTQIKADRATRMAEARRLAGMLKALNEMPLPLIGRVEGVAMGGGVGMASICDLAIAEESCRFGLTETRLGIIPATISPYVMARIGEGMARRIFMNAKLFDGAEAAQLGLVAKALPAADLDAAIEAEIAPYLKLPRGAVGRAKALTRALGMPITDAVIESTIERLADAWEAEEAREGISAFLEKRRPAWDQ
ncbi:MAG: crotonase/enoyl-CoA hydratase family protein [Mangrovicoccus sp.]|nr:crotonase/enoyl-CoA hydratase family protein [Mangrovicoccus sp.]